jgi:PII-like signaling protein
MVRKCTDKTNLARETKGKTTVLRIYISNTDKFRYTPLYQVVVYAARRYGMAGATVIKGVMGFGSSSIIRSSHLWDLTEKLPVIVEIVDEAEHIDRFIEIILPWFERIRYGALITTNEVDVVLYKKGRKKNASEKPPGSRSQNRNKTG